MASFRFHKGSLYMCSRLTAGIFLVLIAAVPEKVIAQCPDCIGEIKRVDATGKCISCFPCPECYDHDGHITSSVPCGATVSYDTDIECVEIQVATPPSSQTKSVASKFTATPVTPILPTSSSLASSALSVVRGEDSGSTKRPDKAVPSSAYYSNWEKNTSVIMIAVIFLLVTFGALASRCKQIRKKHSRQRRVDHNRQVSTSLAQISTVQENGTPNNNFATNTVVFFRTAQSPSSAAAHLTEKITNLPPRLEKKSISTSTTGLFDQTDTFPQISDIPKEFLNYLLSKKVAMIHSQFYRKICQKLDIVQIDWVDYHLLGEKVGLGRDAILLLEQKGNQTEEILRHFDSKRESCVERFKIILEEMGRHDVVTVIEEWILFEWQESIHLSRVI